MQTIRGWLFDLYPSGRGITLWLIDEAGKKTQAYTPFIPKFYMHVKRNDRAKVERTAAKLHCLVSKEWVYKKEIYSGKDLPVLEILVPDTLNFKKIVRVFESEFSYNVFNNSDLTPVQMFLFENRLFPLAFGEYFLEDDNKLASVRLLDRSDTIDFVLPPLSVMTLRPINSEVAPKYQGILNLEAAYDGRTYEILADTAEDLLYRINEHLRRSDPDIIVTSYGDDMLLPWLVGLSQKTKIPIELNRDKSASYRTTNESTYWTYGQIVHRSGAFMLSGRWHIDAENSFIVGESDLDGLFELSRITQIPAQEQGRATIGTGLSSMQLSWAYRNNILIPAKKQEWEKFKSSWELLLADRGGLIYLPIMGYHEQVAELDFTSMFPAIMQIHNVSPETVNCTCCENDSVPELHYTICEKRSGIIPETIGEVLRRRAEYKKREKSAADESKRKEYHKRQVALKWMLVTTFGYLGYKNARFGKIEAHESVNAFARRDLLRAKKLAEDRGFSVIHGIVDCLFLKKESATEQDYERLCDVITEEIGIHISLEGIYKWILFPASRTSPEIPTANRYIGAYTDGEIKVRGLDVRRGDIPLFVRKVQGEVIELMSKASGIDELKTLFPAIMEIVKAHLEVLQSGRVPPIELVVRRTISKEADEYENRSMQAIVAQTMKEAGVPLKPGETAEYIIIDATGKKNPEKAKPFVLYRSEDGYDVDKYTELTLKSIEVLLEPLGYTREEISSFAQP
ncbi:MAG TPA: DNA polymerase domain-containing protein, partial [Candidatus Acidoferrales bacterium]|nr:DNA polymerase domain-containing protein [Candidatus Acidoferrales bacterium]